MAVLSVEETDNVATRHLTSFLRFPREGGPGDGLPPSQADFSISLLPEMGPAGISWKNINIYDVHGNLLFRDKSLGLSKPGWQWRVRTAATDVLAAPVWSVGAGSTVNIPSRAREAFQTALKKGLSPLPGEQSLVCYSYPKLGILCEANRGNGFEGRGRYVVDLSDFSVYGVNSFSTAPSSEHVYVWSPYDSVVPATLPTLRRTWNRNMGSTPPNPRSESNGLLSAAWDMQGQATRERTLGTSMRLIGQIHGMACVPASFQMILHYHGFTQLSQEQIAWAMGTTVEEGTYTNMQAPAIAPLTNGIRVGSLDETPSFTEARQVIEIQRAPIKEAIPGHARVIAGWKTDWTGGYWVYLYDPWPVAQGATYWELYNPSFKPTTNFVYVSRPLY